MEAVFSIRPATKQEMKFAYTTDEGDFTYKCIGHLRADFGRSGDEFWTSWCDHNLPLKTQDFKDDLDAAINRLRSKDKELSPLRNRSAMRKFCSGYPEAREDCHYAENYIFRMDVLAGRKHSFILRMNPNMGHYNLYCYGFRTEDLERGVA